MPVGDQHERRGCTSEHAEGASKEEEEVYLGVARDPDSDATWTTCHGPMNIT